MLRLRELFLAVLLLVGGCATTGASSGFADGAWSSVQGTDQAQQVDQQVQDQADQRWAEQEDQQNQAVEAQSQALQGQINQTSADIFQAQ